MTKSINAPKRLLALMATTALLAAMPLTLQMNAATGAIALKSSVAMAQSGEDHSRQARNDNRGARNHDGLGAGNHDHGTGLDNSTGNDNGTGFDNGNDNGTGFDSGNDNGTGFDSGNDNGTGFDTHGAIHVVNVQHTNSGVRVEMSDGSREVLRNGNYIHRDATGRVVERHVATRADRAHVRALR